MKLKKATYIGIGCMILLLAGAVTAFARNDAGFKNRGIVKADITNDKAREGGIPGKNNAEGNDAENVAVKSIAEGNDAENVAVKSIAEGNNAEDVAVKSIAEGNDAENVAVKSIVEGNNAEENIPEKNIGITVFDDMDYEEGCDDKSLVLKNFEPYGISYYAAKDIWTYAGKQIAGLVSKDNTYVDGDAGDDSVNLEISSKSVKEISATQFQKQMSRGH